MATSLSPMFRFGRMARSASLLIVAGLWPGRSFVELEADVATLGLKDQAVIVGGILAVLFALAVIAAQFGWPGLALYWLAILLIAR